jgi:hypothetical protein
MANEKKGEGRKNGTCYYPTCATSRASADKTVRDERKWVSEIFEDGRDTKRLITYGASM